MNQFGTTGLTIPPQFRCVSGVVTLFRFIQAPPPGSIIGQIQPTFGSPVPVAQTQQTPLGGTSLASVDGRFATVCGLPIRVGGQNALDVRIVNPGAPSPTGTPVPLDDRLLLFLILLLLSRTLGINLGGLTLGSLQGLGTVNLSGLLGPGGVQSLMSALQAQGVDVASLLRSQ